MRILLKGVVCAFWIALILGVFGGSSLSAQNKTLADEILKNRTFRMVDSMGRAVLSKGFNAGSGYSQVWARDLNTFIETACDVMDTKDVRNVILIFFQLQQPNNEMIDGYVVKGEFNWNDPNRYYSDAAPNHVAFKNTVETDQETSLIQLVGKYIRKTGDKAILNEVVAGKTVYERMKMMVDFLLKERYSKRYGLLTGALTADWGDVQANDDEAVDLNKNTILTVDIYDNAMFIIAMNYLMEMGDGADKRYWKSLRDSFAANSRKYLWDSGRQKFIPHLYPEKQPDLGSFNELDVHYHGGTAIAIEAGLLSKSEIAAVNAQMVENVRLSGMKSIGLTLYPVYPDGFFHGGMAKPYIYQNGGDWTWFGGRMIQQLIANGFVREAYAEVQPMMERVIKNNGFYEWYGQGEVPSGSGHFKGSAGVLCKVVEMFYKWGKENK